MNDPQDDTMILQGPDGRLYEFPRDVLAQYAVPGERVAELRAKAAAALGQTPPAASSEREAAAAPAAPHGVPTPPMPEVSVQPTAQGGIVLNFFFHGPPQPGRENTAGPQGVPEGVKGYHSVEDEHGLQTMHTDVRFGSYIDKQGTPAVGFHSHDPVTGNAQ